MSERGPFGADTPDEVLIAYVNGRLSASERAEVDRWLDEHPAWRARLASYSTIGKAVRSGAPPSAGAPDIGSLGGLWAAIDAESSAPAAPTLPAPTPAPPPPPPGNVVSLDARRRQPRWVLGAAAAAVLVVGGAVVVSQRDGEDSNDSAIEEPSVEDAADAGAPGEAPPTLGESPGSSDEGSGEDGETGGGAPPPNNAVPDPTVGEGAPGQGAGDDDVQDLRRAVADTIAAGSARLTVQSSTALDTDGTRYPDDTGLGASLFGEATGVIVFDEGVALDIDLTDVGGEIWPDGSVSSQVVQTPDGTTSVDCGAGFEDISPDESGCALGDGLSPVGIYDLLDVIESGEFELGRVGPDPDGLVGYLVETELTIAGEPRPVEIQVYVDPADGLIRFMRLYNPDRAVIPVEVGGPEMDPVMIDSTFLYLNIELTDHGADVELPDVD